MAVSKGTDITATPRGDVLITRFSALGDVAMCLPVVYDLCRAYPDTRFIFVTKPAMKGLFVNPPVNLKVEGVDTSRYKGVGGLRRLLNELTARYDITDMADLHDVLRTRVLRILCRLKGIRVSKIDKGRSEKRALTRKSGKHMKQLATSHQRYTDTFGRLGLKTDGGQFRSVFGGTKADTALLADVTAPKKAGEKWVGIAPFAAHRGKIYPAEMMEQVVKALHERGDTRIFFFGGGEAERAVLAGWVEKYPGSVSMAEKRHGFAIELALMSHLDAMVTMDSGNMHLASLAGVPAVSIWGATHPYCGFRAYGQNPDLEIQTDLSCRPCSVYGNRPCHNPSAYACMTHIEPKTITDKLNRILDNDING